MSVEIRETIVTPAHDGDVVQLHISDAPPGDESASFDLRLTAKIPKYGAPLLIHLQRAAMRMADAHLTDVLQRTAADAQKHRAPLEPWLADEEGRY